MPSVPKSQAVLVLRIELRVMMSSISDWWGRAALTYHVGQLLINCMALNIGTQLADIGFGP